jgi:acetylornithine deacetylase
MMKFLKNYLTDLGFSVQTQDISDGRFNILARKGEPKVVLSTHTDTVNPYFPSSEDERYIYGRGACDTKGIIAAMLEAADISLKKGMENFGLLFVVGEEDKSDGAIAANTLPNQCKYLINGEPTENKMATGTKGVIRLKITAHGKACHSAYPERGESAIEKLLDILQDIRAMELPDHPLLGRTTNNIGVIKGGIQANVIPPEAEAILMTRVVTSTQEIRDQLSTVIGNRADADFYFKYEPVLTKVLPGYPTMVASYGTDIPFLNNWGEPILFGPGSILDAHTANEKIDKRQLEEAIHHFVDMVVQLLKDA